MGGVFESGLNSELSDFLSHETENMVKKLRVKGGGLKKIEDRSEEQRQQRGKGLIEEGRRNEK